MSKESGSLLQKFTNFSTSLCYSFTASRMSNKRPQTSGSRSEAELKDKAERALAKAKCPIEKLRLFALARGAKGILGLGR